MLFDLLNTDMYMSYNIKIANIIGLHYAIHLQQLININRKAIKKGSVNDSGFFRVNRAYIQSCTTFTELEQRELECGLKNLNLIDLDESNSDFIKVDIVNVANTFSSDNEKLVENISKVIQSKANPSRHKMTKEEVIKKNLKSYITCSNEELKIALESWVDSVYSNPNGFLSKVAVEVFQKELNEYCKHDLDLALAIVSIASVNGWKDCEWAINAYERKQRGYSSQYKQTNNNNFRGNNTYSAVKPKVGDEEF